MRLPPHARLGLLLWTITLCVVSQIPYRLVWQGLSTFPYDAFTTFNPWFVGQLAELRAGEGILALYQDEVPFDVWPSYVFTGVLRQLFAVFQANTAIGHALVQASHGVLMVPAIALLCRSLGVPWRYGAVGGLVFTLAGIHVSLAHHVLAHEALLYLALSLFCIRATLLGWERFAAMQRVAVFAITGIVTCSLVRVHHEAILYLIPLAAWALGHIIVLHHRSGGAAMTRAAGAMGGLGILVAIASVPMLVTTYELSLVNKTAIDSYEQLGPYFSDPRAFFASLVLPGFSGSNSEAMPVAFGFGQEATLSYVFFGTLTLPFLVVVLVTWWRDGRRVPAAVLAATVVMVVGYAIGAGSPIHRLLCTAFPFLVKIGHNYYGLHLLYLLAAFVVADGLRIVTEQRRYSLLFAVAVIQLGLSAVLFHQARENMGWGPQGSLPAFVASVTGDLRWQVWLVGVLALLALIGGVRTRGNTLIGHASGRVGTARIEWLALLAVTALVGTDLLRPIQTAHFLPNRQWVEWGTSPLGGFNPSREVRRFLNALQRTQQRPLRVLPIFPMGGGWQGNALMATDMHLVGMPGDSGGNRHVEAWLSKGPDASRLMKFIDRYGVDAVWVSRWGVDDWAAALAATPLVKVYSTAYGGDVYMRPSPPSERAVVRGNAVHLPWGLGGKQSVVEQGLVTRTWRFVLPALEPGTAVPRQINLPLMWHAGYGIALDGTSIAGDSSVDGTLVVTVPPGASRSQELVVRYPNQPIAVLVALAAIIYGGLLVLLGWSCLSLLRKPAPARRAPPPPVAEPTFRRVP